MRKKGDVAEPFGLACTAELVHAGEYVCRKGWRVDGLAHPFDGLFYVISGGCEYEVDGRMHDARAGDLFFMARGSRLTARLKGCEQMGTLSAGFRLDVAGAMSLLSRRSLPDRVRLKGAKGAKVTKRFWELVRAAESRRAGGELQAVGALLELLHESTSYAVAAGEEKSAGGTVEAAHDRRSLVLGLIEEKLGETIRVAEMARWGNLSKGQFSRWFSRQMGQSAMAYVRSRRMARARELLAQGGLTVAQVARRSGYGDTAHFRREFNKAHGKTPTAYAAARQAGKRV